MAVVQSSPQKRETLPAWSVKRLAVAWDCSRSAIYEMIEVGELQTFPIGKRGIRISDQEKKRWEGRNANNTATGISLSERETAMPLPTTAMRMITGAARG